MKKRREMEKDMKERSGEMNDRFTDFMLFIYFGITEEDNLDAIRHKCAKRAYQDLARTVNYTISATKLEEMKKKEDDKKEEAKKFIGNKEQFIDSINKTIVSEITNHMPKPNDQKYETDSFRAAFDEWHGSTCEKIVEVKSDIIKEGSLTYGQAQKWLNMTIKYMRFFPDIVPSQDRRLESALHVPVDHFILQAAWEAEEKCSEKVIQFPLNPNRQNNRKGTFSDGEGGKVLAWSNWNEGQYKDFQVSLRQWCDEQGVYPMEWEAKAWMKAKKKTTLNKIKPLILLCD